jgi:NTE family protein
VFPAVNPSVGGLEWLVRGARPDGPDRAFLHPRFGWVLDVVRAKLLGTRSEWLQVNTMPQESVHNALLASAALPIVLPPRVLGGRPYRDGGFADNLPIGALANRIDVRRVVVVHLRPYPLLNHDEFPDLDLIEIMPSRPLDPQGQLGIVSGLIDLSPDKVTALFELGYADARDQLGRVWEHEGIVKIADFTQAFRRDAVGELNEPR